MAAIKHVFFDLDHTLWDFEKNSDLTFKKIFLKHDINTDLIGFLKIYKPLNIEYWKLYREEKINKEELRYQRLKTAFDAINYEISDDLIDILAIDYIECLPDYNHLFEGTFEILEYL
ncbi:MAG: putative hydrolase of the HAD superfamily, partial [Polaribacter sp.]